MREIKKLTGLQIEGEIAFALLSNPAVIGTVLYLIIDQMKPKPSGSQAPQIDILKGLSQSFGNVLGSISGLGSTVGSITSSLTPGGVLTTGGVLVTLEALQASLLIYIASGGNLAGVLTGASSIVSKLVPAAVLK
jgi:hypothetical protein